MLRARLWLALVLVIACRAWPAAAESLTVGAAAPSPGQCALMMARDLGLFRTQDLDVDLVFFDSGTEAIQALVGGRVPIGAVGASAVVNAGLAGADATLIAGFVNRLTYSLGVVPEIATPADLKGKAIGVNRFGSSNDFAARLALTRLGLQPDRDVTLLQLGSSAARPRRAVGARHPGRVLNRVLSVSAARVPRAGGLSRPTSGYPLEGVAARGRSRESTRTVSVPAGPAGIHASGRAPKTRGRNPHVSLRRTPRC
jgi:hypothetical protein